MIKQILKRGIMGSILSLVTTISMALGILIISGNNEITIQISTILKFVIIIMSSGFIISASTIIFNAKKISLLMKIMIHFILTILILKTSITYVEVLKEEYLLQAIFILLYVIVSAICLLSIVSQNKADIKLINEKLRMLDKV